jgi:single-strand DNA-binding protein
MQNIAEFRIIGRISRIDRRDKVTFLDIASNYHHQVNDEWQQDTHWNRVTLFSRLHDRAARYAKGDLIHVTGRIRQKSYDKGSERVHTVDLIAERAGVILAHDRTERGEDPDDDLTEN